jgi:hypothetical protein
MVGVAYVLMAIPASVMVDLSRALGLPGLGVVGAALILILTAVNLYGEVLLWVAALLVLNGHRREAQAT